MLQSMLAELAAYSGLMSCVLAAAYLLADVARLGQHTWPVVSQAAASTHVHSVSYVQQPPGAAQLRSQPAYCTTLSALLCTATMCRCGTLWTVWW